MRHTKLYLMLFSLVSLLSIGGYFTRKQGVLFSMEQLAEFNNIVPIAVIGSGPAGLMAGIYGARGGKETYLFRGNKPGGLLMDTTEVENWPAEIMTTGPKIIEKLEAQAQHQGVIFIDSAIERVDTSIWPYKLYTDNGEVVSALTVVIATGASPRRLNVPGEDAFWGAGVTACAVCDAPFYRGQDVVVIGGGDSAVEEAIQLSSFAKNITILVRKGSMRAASSMQNRLKAYENISIKYNISVERILGNQVEVTGIQVHNNITNKTEIIPVSGVFLAIGHIPNTTFIKGVIETNSDGYINVQGRTQATSVPGIFAAGDVEDHRYRQAGSSAGYGIAAGLDAVRFLDDHGYSPMIAQRIKKQLYKVSDSEVQTPFIKELQSVDQFNQLIASHNVVILDFWGNNCPTCKQMLPIFRSEAEYQADKALFLSVNIDQAPEIAQKLFVHKIPCIIAFKDGKLAERYSGMLSKKEFREFVDRVVEVN